MCIIIIVSKQNKTKVNIPSSGGNRTVQCAGVLDVVGSVVAIVCADCWCT